MFGQRWISLFSVLAWLLLHPSWAWADSVTVQANNITFDRAVPRGDEESPLAISRKDCVDDVLIHFPVTIRANSRPMEIWVGNGDCTVEQERINDVCVNVWEDYVNSETNEIVISTQAFLKGEINGSCDASNSRDAVTVNVLFALENNGKPSTVAGEYVTIQQTYDLAGPPAPSVEGVTPGEGKVVVKWDAEDSPGNPVGFRVYCATGMDTSTSTTGAAGAPSSSCSSTLVAGEVPPDELQCGEVAGQSATSTIAKGLSNGSEYAVGVAAVDSVGNVGDLALGPRCVTPQEVTDFYEAYVAAGGKGGGGYCAFGRKPGGGLAALMVLVVAGAWLGRRRQS